MSGCSVSLVTPDGGGPDTETRARTGYTPPATVPHGAVALLLYAGIAYFAVGGIAFPVLPRLVEIELGGSESAIGVTFGAMALGMLIVRPFVGYLSDRYGRRPTMVLGALVIAGLQLLHVPAAEEFGLWGLVGLRIFIGMAASLMYVSQATTATELPPAQRRGTVFATFSTAIFVGFAIGPVVGEWVYEEHGFSAAFAVAAVIGFTGAVASALLPETRPASVQARFESIRGLFHPIATRIGTMNLLVFLTFIGFNAFITPYAEELGVTSTRWLLLTYSGTTLLMRALGGRLLDRADRMKLASAAFTLVAIGVTILAFAPSVPWLYVGAFVTAVGLAYNVPLLILIGSDSAPDEERAPVVATITTFGDLANSGGALLLGMIAASFDYTVMYLFIAGGAVGALVLLHSPFMRPVTGLRAR